MITERRKYEKAWSLRAYRKYSPGEQAIPIFRQLARKRGSLIDIGCGTGRAGKALNDAGWDVTLMDFAANAPEVDLPFHRGSILGKWPGEYDYGYCCDVMEHLPPTQVDKAIKKMLAHCKRVFFSIHFGPDNFGQAVGHPLHLTIKPFAWWRDKLKEYATLVDARDLIGIGAFYASRDV